MLYQLENCVITTHIWIYSTRFRKDFSVYIIYNRVEKLLICDELRRKTFGDIGGTECTERLCEYFGDFFFVFVDISR